MTDDEDRAMRVIHAYLDRLEREKARAYHRQIKGALIVARDDTVLPGSRTLLLILTELADERPVSANKLPLREYSLPLELLFEPEKFGKDAQVFIFPSGCSVTRLRACEFCVRGTDDQGRETWLTIKLVHSRYVLTTKYRDGNRGATPQSSLLRRHTASRRHRHDD